LSEPQIEGINLPTGVPKVYRLNEQMLAAESHFHGDPKEIEARIQSVAHQTRRT
jgi:2,3-bisphosphoglycerate-dependent phosphoglycerate mutase